MKNFIVHGTGLLLLFVFPLLIACSHAEARQADSPRATLKGWTAHQRLFIMDRSNNFGGFYYNRGLFRMTTPPMDTEYYLDILTYRFSYFEDHEWQQADGGFRSYMGSLNTPFFALNSELKSSVSVGNNGTLNIHAWQQQDQQANRGLITLNYHYRLSEKHRVGVLHTLDQHKTDLDATLIYQYGTQETGRVTTELTLLDWTNNFVSDLSADRQSEFEIRHSYSKKPYLFSLRLESPQVGPFRGEAVAAFQPESRAEVVQRDLPGENFKMNDHVNYQAALLEAHYRGATAGIIWQRTFARTERYPTPGSGYELNFGNRQIQNRGGAYLHFRWRSVGIEQWFFIERNRDQQFDENPDAYAAQDENVRFYDRLSERYPFNFEEIRRFNKTRIFYSPPGHKLSAYIEHNGDWRNPHFDTASTRVPAINYRNYYPNQIVQRNERLTLGIKIQFSETAQLTLGASVDLDGDKTHGFGGQREDTKRANFDGGFGRLQLLW